MSKKIVVNRTKVKESAIVDRVVHRARSVDSKLARQLGAANSDLPGTISSLRAQLDSSQDKVRKAALVVLGQVIEETPAYWYSGNVIRPEVVQVVERLIEVLQDRHLEGLDPAELFESLGKFGGAIDKGNVESPVKIAQAISDWASRSLDKNTEVLISALDAIKACGIAACGAVVPRLAHILQCQHSQVRRRVCLLFCWMGHDGRSALRDVLQKALKDKDADVRRAATRAVIRMDLEAAEIVTACSNLDQFIEQLCAVGREGQTLRSELSLQQQQKRAKAAAKKKESRGRPRKGDPKKEARVVEAWATGQYPKYEDLARARGQGESGQDIEKMIGNSKKREVYHRRKSRS